MSATEGAKAVSLTPDPAEIRRIEDYWMALTDKYLESLIKPPASSGFNTASELGFNCLTFQVLRRLHGELRPRKTVSQEKIFRLGNILEDADIKMIRAAGLDIEIDIEDARYEWKKFRIVGYLDAKVRITNPLDAGQTIIVPFEHKTCSPNVFRSILKHKVEGIPLTKSKYPWIQKYPAQLMIYMLFKNSPFGLWCFIEKSSGNFLYWLEPLDFEYAETLLKMAETANEYVDRNEVPKPAFKEICSHCDFAMSYCFPDRSFGEGFELIDDETIALKIKRMKELEAAVEEYDELKEALIGTKSKPGAVYGKNLIVDDYMIESKLIKTTIYDIPKDIKAPFAKSSEYFRTTIDRIGTKED